MTRRNVNNERYTVEANDTERHSKKSASKAKPARKAASSVHAQAKPKKSRRELRKESREKEQKRLQREQARYGVMSNQESIDIANIKRKQMRTWRTIWWVLIGVAAICIVAAFMLQETNATAFIAVIGLSYILLGAALAIEFGKIRKLRNRTYVVTKKSKKAIKHEIEELNAAEQKKSALQNFKKRAKGSASAASSSSKGSDLPFDES